MHQKDQPPEEEEFSSLDRLMSLEQSDGDRYRGEQDIWPADQMKQRDRLCFTLSQMKCRFQNGLIRYSRLFRSNIKRKRRQLKKTGLIELHPGSGSKKIID